MYKTIEKVLILHEIDVFSLAATEHLGKLAIVCRTRQVTRGEVIYEAGASCKTLHILVSGKIELGSPNGRRAISESCCLDFWAFFAESPHYSKAQALSDCVLFELDFHEVSDILTAEPELSLAILKFLARQGRALNAESEL